jgi:hypothetical protein
MVGRLEPVSDRLTSPRRRHDGFIVSVASTGARTRNSVERQVALVRTTAYAEKNAPGDDYPGAEELV